MSTTIRNLNVTAVKVAENEHCRTYEVRLSGVKEAEVRLRRHFFANTLEWRVEFDFGGRVFSIDELAVLQAVLAHIQLVGLDLAREAVSLTTERRRELVIDG